MTKLKFIWVQRILLTFVTFIALIGFAEAAIRWMLFSSHIQIPCIENPALYTDPQTQDDYWVLYHYDSAAPYKTKPIVPHPLLGWTQKNGGELGTRSPKYQSTKDVTGHPILFFGDSFVAGPDDAKLALPQILEKHLPNASVLNYGVGGYGVDQIALRVKQDGTRFRDRNAQIVIGIMLRDLDRSLLRFRHSQKPYYTIEQGELRLHHPETLNNLAFIDSYTFQTRSFVVAAIKRKFRFTTQRIHAVLGHQNELSEKRYLLNKAILKDLIAHLKSESLSADFVIFYSESDLKQHADGTPSLRECELKTIFSELRVTYIDTAPALTQAIQSEGMKICDLYDKSNHFTPTANEMIARSLAPHLELGTTSL